MSGLFSKQWWNRSDTLKSMSGLFCYSLERVTCWNLVQYYLWGRIQNTAPVHTLSLPISQHAVLWGRRECALVLYFECACTNNTAPNFNMLHALSCSNDDVTHRIELQYWANFDSCRPDSCRPDCVYSIDIFYLIRAEKLEGVFPIQ